MQQQRKIENVSGMIQHFLLNIGRFHGNRMPRFGRGIGPRNLD